MQNAQRVKMTQNNAKVLIYRGEMGEMRRDTPWRGMVSGANGRELPKKARVVRGGVFDHAVFGVALKYPTAFGGGFQRMARRTQ